jgi:flagellar capping protein FliD
MANDGTLSLDESKLDDVLANKFSNFQTFFQSVSLGFAQNFSTDLNTLNAPNSGIVAVNLTENSNTQKMLTDAIADFEDRLAVRQQFLINEYSRVDAMLRQLPLLQAQISSQLDASNNN